MGNYLRQRDQEELLRTMPRILTAKPNSHLIIVGRNTEVLRPLIRDLGLADKVILTGPIAPAAPVTGSNSSQLNHDSEDRRHLPRQ